MLLAGRIPHDLGWALEERQEAHMIGSMSGNATYVWSEDVVGDRRLVDSRVLVGLEMDQSVIGDALGGSFF